MIPGWLISILTFPGVIVHELSHGLFCHIFNVEIHEACFFRFGNPAGYVIHDEPKYFWQTFLISIGPFFVNSATAFLVGSYALTNGSHASTWLAVSLGVHAFPSRGDANIIWSSTKAHLRKGHIFSILSVPVVIVIHTASFLSFLWFDVAYGIVVGMALPQIMTGMSNPWF